MRDNVRITEFWQGKRAVIGVFFGVATPIVLEINFLRGAKTDAAHLFRDAAHDGGKIVDGVRFRTVCGDRAEITSLVL